MTHFKKLTLLGKLTAVTWGGSLLTVATVTAQPNADNPSAEVMTRGPVHEAFVGTISYNPTPGVIVEQAPPTLIEEVPPEQRLEGENVTWIPGYWAWDEDQNDFLWVSGIWRNLPPDREWVPGYWADNESRHQWTSGYWEDVQNTEVSYLPTPPRSVESGPSVEAASNDQTWIPGNWTWRENRYAWRAGYWVTARENWSWTPSYYRWTHRGYVYVDGYWDYPVARRGVVFAPVHFQREYISQPDFSYSPVTVINLSVFTNHLFVRPNYGHYYFGDYYEPTYRDRGYFASYSYNSERRGYDPIHEYDRWENRNDRSWGRQRQEYFEHRRDNRDARPPRTMVALNSRSQEDRERGDFGVADRFDRVVGNRASGRQRFQTVNAQEREGLVSQRREIRKFGKERAQLESRREATSSGERASDGSGSNRVKVGRSPVVARKSERTTREGGPPARLQPRQSDQNTRSSNNKTRGDATKAVRSNEPNTARGEQTGRTNKAQTAVESRTRPGQKRAAEPTAGKRQTAQAATRQVDSNPKSRPQRQATPNSETKTRPEAQRQATDPTRQAANPQRREANSTPKRQATPTPERRANQNPERKANPMPERRANQNPERKANPMPRRSVEAQPQRNRMPSETRRAAPAPTRRENAQPQQSTTRRQEPKRAAPQQAAPRAAQRQASSDRPQKARTQESARPQPQRTKSSEGGRRQSRKNDE